MKFKRKWGRKNAVGWKKKRNCGRWRWRKQSSVECESGGKNASTCIEAMLLTRSIGVRNLALPPRMPSSPFDGFNTGNEAGWIKEKLQELGRWSVAV